MILISIHLHRIMVDHPLRTKLYTNREHSVHRLSECALDSDHTDFSDFTLVKEIYKYIFIFITPLKIVL